MRKTMRTATESEPSAADREAISADELAALDADWRAANDLGAAQVYLRENVLLEEPLHPEHIKPRLLGHWGAVPAINFLDAHLNRLIRAFDAEVLLVTGPGHGAPANLAKRKLADARPRAEAHGDDPPEIADGTWTDGEE
jgi:xylulose-5-phosphate/fructose-6-phosphate phosphoketolase